MASKAKCLIVDEVHESIFSLMEDAGIDYTYSPQATRDQIREELRGNDVLFIRSKTRVDADLLTNADNLKVVGRAGAGVDNIDEHYLKSKGINLINAPEGNKDAVGEQTVGMLLSLMHNVVKSHNEITRDRTWDREGNRGEELFGKTVGIIGYGNMGMSFARRLKMFGCKVLAYDKYKTNYADEFCEAVDLADIHKHADVLSLHIPLTDETRMWIDDRFFSQFEKPIYFLNVARGEIVAMSSIQNALESGKVKAAALDVLENEKLSTLNEAQEATFQYLRSSSRVIMTPHIGGWSIESYRKINEVLVEKLTSLLSIN